MKLTINGIEVEAAEGSNVLEAALDACPVVITGRPDGATCADYGDGVLMRI